MAITWDAVIGAFGGSAVTGILAGVARSRDRKRLDDRALERRLAAIDVEVAELKAIQQERKSQ